MAGLTLPQLIVPQLFTIAETRKLLSLSRTTIYEEMAAGRLRWVKRGRSRRISSSAITDYIALLENETARVA